MLTIAFLDIVCSGSPANFSELCRLYRIAAQRNLSEGVYSLGYCYEHGVGVPQNLTQALALYEALLHENAAWIEHAIGALPLRFGSSLLSLPWPAGLLCSIKLRLSHPYHFVGIDRVFGSGRKALVDLGSVHLLGALVGLLLFLLSLRWRWMGKHCILLTASFFG